MLTFTGKVLNVDDSTVSLPVKTKEGIPTGVNRDFRKISVQLLVENADKSLVALNVQTLNPDSSFVIPKIGANWTTPVVRKYDATKGFPEVTV